MHRRRRRWKNLGTQQGDAMRGNPINRLEHSWTRPTAYGPELTELSPTSQWKRKARDLEENAENFIGEHPRLALAGAAVLGLVLGWMVKRK
jgi:ElaB/YqjD/DUF883 family membrane-anchored ribosome-binding protein